MRQGTHLRCVVDQDGAAILDMNLGVISTLNATGGYVWRGIARGESVETIIRNLADETGEDLVAVNRDVKEFLLTLQQKHLLAP